MKLKHLNQIVGMAVGALLLNSVPSSAAINFATSDGTNYTALGTGINLAIPDNTPVGLGYALNFDATGLSVAAVDVTLNISGGYNGDLYAYLSFGDTLVQLLNPDPAVSGSGFDNVTLSAGGSGIPTGGSGALTGSYAAYGNLGNFGNVDPTGMWTLFFADMSAGDTSVLNSFSVNIVTVPEPGTLTLVVLGGLILAVLAVGRAKFRGCKSTGA